MSDPRTNATQPELVFTYGTLRPSLYPHVLRRFRAQAKGFGILESNFAMYNLGAFPALVKGLKGDDGLIRGEVIELPDLRQADGYESYSADGDGLYDRITQRITMDDGRVLTAWVYFMSSLPSSINDAIDYVESGDWADVVRKGKRG